MKYAVEARIFNSGKIVAKKRLANDEEQSIRTSDENCDIWLDVFDTEQEATDFLRMYKS